MNTSLSSSQDGDTLKNLKTRYRLIDLASKHMANSGYEGMSLRKVAEEAGVSPAAVYRHFPSGKVGLYEATLALVAENLGSIIDATADTSVSSVDIVEFQCRLLWDFFESNANVASMIVRENINGGRDGKGPSPYLNQHMEHIFGMKRFLRNAIEHKDIKPINISAFLFWVTSYITNFHGCTALKEATWDEADLKGARAHFFLQLRDQLTPEASVNK